MDAFWDKIFHFIVGLVIGYFFWQLLERKAPMGVRAIHPIAYLVGLVWAASGLFFFRLLKMPVLSHQLFYMAIPDWDIPIQQFTKLSFLMHRSWLFHSAIGPAIVFLSCLILARRVTTSTGWQLAAINLLRDFAIGLLIGVCAHLLWDALLSSTRAGFRIHGWSVSTSALWLLLNLTGGIALPFFVVRSWSRGNFLPRSD